MTTYIDRAADVIAGCWPNGRGVRKDDADILARALADDGRLAREWPAGTADKMNEWAESQLGFSLEPWQMDWLRQMEEVKQ